MQNLLTIIQSVVAIALTFGLAVFVHEFGHMFFALIRGVGVESFAIGMGPKITEWRWKGIDFSLRWLPVGGFVKLRGPVHHPEPGAMETSDNSLATVGDLKADPDAPAAPEQAADASGKSLAESSYDDLYALADKSTLTKLMVFGGGVFMNFVTAILAIALLMVMGQEMQLVRFTVDTVKEGSALAQAGLRDGDVVTAVNDKKVVYFSDFSDVLDDQFESVMPKRSFIERHFTGGPLPEPQVNFMLTVQRGDQSLQVPFKNITPTQFGDLFGKSLSLKIPPVLSDVVPNSPAAKAGLKPGDRIVSVNGKAVTSFGGMAEIIRANPDKQCEVVYERDGARKTVQVTPIKNVVENAQEGMIGVAPVTEMRLVRENNPFVALLHAPGQAWALTREMAVAQARFFHHASLKDVGDNLGGPIAIAVITAHNAHLGIRYAIDWFIKLNLLLLIFNLLPIPVLDGGFIFLSLLEAVIRRPVPPWILGPIYTAFMILFMCFFVVVSLLDIRHLF